jgi:hypothetical protein
MSGKAADRWKMSEKNAIELFNRRKIIWRLWAGNCCFYDWTDMVIKHKICIDLIFDGKIIDWGTGIDLIFSDWFFICFTLLD